MKRYLLLLAAVIVSEISFAQASCPELNGFLDSLHLLNVKRMALGEDTGSINQFYRDHYRSLRLYGMKGQATGYAAQYIHFEIDMKSLNQVRQCLVERANKNNWYIKWHDPDETGFRRFSVYDTKKQKNSILFYDNIFNKANMDQQTGSFTLALSLYW